MTDAESKRRAHNVELDDLVLGLLALEILLLLSDRFQVCTWNRHGTVLIGLAVLGAGSLFLLARYGLRVMRRRASQFSLASLLLYTLVCAIVCSWFAANVHRAKKQGEAAKAIKALGGTLVYDNGVRGEGKSLRSPPVWLVRVLGYHFFSDAVGVWDLGADFCDADMVHVRALTKLEDLYLDGTQVTDVGLKHVERLTELDLLDLAHTRVTDAGLKHLRGLAELRRLSLCNTQVTDAGLKHLRGLAKLHHLSLYNTQVTDEGVEKLREALSNCTFAR